MLRQIFKVVMTEIIIHVLHMRNTEAWRVKVADSKTHVELEEMLKLNSGLLLSDFVF